MACYLGFEPTTQKPYYFISYNSQDVKRVSLICQEMYRRGVPMWYDRGLYIGEKWEKQIALRISECSEVIVFVTKKLMARADPYVQKEYLIAKDYGKKINIVFLDEVSFTDVIIDLKGWFVEINQKHGLSVPNATPAETVDVMDSAMHFALIGNNQKLELISNSSHKFARIMLSVAAVVVIVVTGILLLNQFNKGSSTSDKKNISSDSSEVDSVPGISSESIDLSKGDIYTMGTYQQEPIEWRVLYVEDDQALLITDKVIDYVKYNDEFTAVTWETCTLRKWMNKDFYNQAFSSSEKNRIIEVTNDNPDNPEYNTSGGRNTKDKVFALSYAEVNTYISSVSDRIGYTTDYAHIRKYDNANRSEYWWLRTPGSEPRNAARINDEGEFNYLGRNVHFPRVGIRPAMWIKLN